VPDYGCVSMRVDLMRKVDYWLGIPLCFFFSIVNLFTRLIPRPNVTKPRKILFMELSEMGSPILAYPSIEKCKAQYSGAVFYFLIFNELKESVEVLGAIPKENILTIRSSSFFSLTFDTFRLFWKFRSERFDVVLDLELFSRFTALLTYFSGAKWKIGFHNFTNEGLYRGNFLTHKVSYNQHVHMSRNFLSLVYAIAESGKEIPVVKRPVDVSVTPAQVLVSDDQKRKILDKLKLEDDSVVGKKIVLLNPNASERLPLRRWPLSNYCQLAKNLLGDEDVIIVVTGTAAEKKDALAVVAACGERCIDFTGKTTLRELIHLYSVSSVLVTNDSGPGHFASLTKIPTFVFFGPETPVLYKPLGDNCSVFYSDFSCSPCVSAANHRKSPCSNNRCLKAIQVDGVLKAVRQVIGKGF
jgi:ADP-heptose:LPS heptosyltransferase